MYKPIKNITTHQKGMIKRASSDGLLKFWEIGCCSEGYIVILQGKFHIRDIILHIFENNTLIPCVFCAEETNRYFFLHIEQCKKCKDEMIPFTNHKCKQYKKTVSLAQFM